MELSPKLTQIKLILSDVDGVLTDGSLTFDQEGHEIKTFYARDGLGITIWRRKGGRFAFVTRRSTEVVQHRAEELGVEAFQGVMNKRDLLEQICQQSGLTPEEVAYIGDDLVDEPIMRSVGFSAAPADAVEEIRAIADFVAHFNGGRGAVRETIEQILKAQGKWCDFGF